MEQEAKEAPTKDTLKEFQAMCVEVWKQRAVCDTLGQRLDAEKKKLEDVKKKVLAYMTEYEIEKHNVPGLGSVYAQQKFSWKVPKDEDRREAFFNYLKQKQIFESMVTVPSATLNSFAKKELEAAVEEGNVDFEVPGLGEPTSYHVLGMRKS